MIFVSYMNNAHKEHTTPACIGIIMDGNRRWAKSHGVPIARGHEAGYETLKRVIGWAREEGVGTVIAYAFSTENWNRSELEVRLLMELFDRAVTEIGATARAEHIRVSFIGEGARFSPALQKKMDALEHESKDSATIHLVLALSYGGRAEIVDAVNTLLASGASRASDEDVARALWTGCADISDPDLIIRTGGEMRLSNFLLWQAAYSELFFTKTLWPDFSHEEFRAIIAEYGERERRQGK